MFLTPAVPRLNNENTNVIAKKTPSQAAPRRAFGDIPVNVKNTASPAFSKLNAQKIHKKPVPVKVEPPKQRALQQFYIRPDDEDGLDFEDFPSFNEPKDDYSDIRPVGEMEKNIKNMMFSYRDSITPPPLASIQDEWDCDKFHNMFLQEESESCYDKMLMLDSPLLETPSYVDISLPEMDSSFDFEF